MIPTKPFRLFFIGCLIACVPAQAEALKLADPFGDEMVLQRGMAVPVWGQAEPGVEVSVSCAGQTKAAKANGAGQWLVKLDPLTTSTENRVLAVRIDRTHYEFN